MLSKEERVKVWARLDEINDEWETGFREYREIARVCITYLVRQDVPALLDTLDEKDAEIERLQTWVNDLQSGMYVNCVYCGYRYGPENKTPSSMADVLKEHIEQCPKHPMSTLKADRALYKARAEIAEARAGALERAIYNRCGFCVSSNLYGTNPSQMQCDMCLGRPTNDSLWQFDEARFTEGE